MATILIIDDSPFSRRVMKALLVGGGHRVVEAGEGLAGIEAYSLDRPDVVLLDMTMQGMQGLEVLQQLTTIDPTARVLIASADIQSATRQQTASGGAVGFVVKPFVGPDVLSRVDAALRGDTAW